MSISGTFGSSEKALAVSQILNEGIPTRNLTAAIEKRRAVLSDADRNVLLSLTDAELAAMQSINAKLAPLGLSALY